MGAARAAPAMVTRARTAELMLPDHSNPAGNVHGGEILKLVENATWIAASRHVNAKRVSDGSGNDARAALVPALAHVARGIVQGAVATLELRDDVGESYAAKLCHVLGGGERQSDTGQHVGHDVGKQGFAIDQGAIAVEQQAQRMRHDGGASRA